MKTRVTFLLLTVTVLDFIFAGYLYQKGNVTMTGAAYFVFYITLFLDTFIYSIGKANQNPKLLFFIIGVASMTPELLRIFNIEHAEVRSAIGGVFAGISLLVFRLIASHREKLTRLNKA